MTKDTVNEFKKRLQAVLDRLDLAHPVTVSDIEDIVWNERDASDFNQLIMKLLEGTDVQHVNDTVQIIQEAWNTFPHQSLGSKTPHQIHETQSRREDALKDGGVNRKRKTFSDVFADSFPEKTQLVSIGEVEWGFEYPQRWHALAEDLVNLEQSNMTGAAYERTLKDMLTLMPELFDAADSLAHYYGAQHNLRQAKRLYENEIALARKYIPKEFIPGEHHIIWAYMDNRPFLRLLNSYAQFIEQTEKVSQAIPLYEELLAYSPNDNQGVRYVLATAYLKTGQPDKLIDLVSNYPDDIGPELAMGTVLALFRLGMEDEAQKHLKKNKKRQQHVIKELLKTTHPQPEGLIEDRVTVGGKDEAWYYWRDQGSLWEATKGAKEFLKDT